MNSWAIFTLAFAAVVIQAWVRGRGFTRSLQIILFGAAIPITLLVSAWLRKRDEEGEEIEGEPKEQEN